MRVALVHDWLTGMRGGEKVLEGILSCYPNAPIYTLVHLPGSVSRQIESHPIHTSFVQRLPGIAAHYRKYLPFFPRAIEQFDLSGYDLVISSSHCVAKGVRPGERAVHVCYCHTPMRYIWDAYEDYFGPGRAPAHVRAAMALAVAPLRRWDVTSSRRVSAFVANSHNVAYRIRRTYGRTAEVVHPWVDHATFTPGPDSPSDDFLVVSALVPYKRVELAIEAFRGLDSRLVVAGGGPELARLRRLAPPNVTFQGRVSDTELRTLYRRCRALVFPGPEDFGIVPLEAMACGRPVIAFAEGGALETVVDGVTGTFFREPTAASLRAAVETFDADAWDPDAIRRHALRFDRERFLGRFRDIVDTLTSDGAPRRTVEVAHGTR